MSVKDPTFFYGTGKVIIMCILVAVFSDMNPVPIEKVLGDLF
jgi:hypothetical protein